MLDELSKAAEAGEITGLAIAATSADGETFETNFAEEAENDSHRLHTAICSLVHEFRAYIDPHAE